MVAVELHAKGIWSIGLVTGANGLPPLTAALGKEMVTVFIPSSPTAFTGYVVVVPRESLIELPMEVEETMRLLVSGGSADAANFRPRRSPSIQSRGGFGGNWSPGPAGGTGTIRVQAAKLTQECEAST